jgi:lipid-A-disaccharide synthase
VNPRLESAGSDRVTRSSSIRIGIVAGEASGDNLGGGLMAALKSRYPNCTFTGIGGPRMLEQGLQALVPMERLTVNGFVDPIKRLPELLGILRLLIRTFRTDPPQVFVGVDFNVFNLLLERLLKRRGIPTVHYVSPSVYAWRRGRVQRLSRAADMLLALYPFEVAFYEGVPVEAVFVGHPLADEISAEDGGPGPTLAARERLGVPLDARCIAVLPGSRMSEVRLLAEIFLGAAAIIARALPSCVFVVPCLSSDIAHWIQARLRDYPGLSVVTYHGDARLALTACEGALIKSGTSTLEAMLLGRPMVVSYKLGELSYQLVRRLLRTRFIALPNILAGEELVPELLQHQATSEGLAEKLLAQLDKARAEPEYLARFADLHRQLAKGADQRAADAISRWFRS